MTAYSPLRMSVSGASISVSLSTTSCAAGTLTAVGVAIGAPSRSTPPPTPFKRNATGPSDWHVPSWIRAGWPCASCASVEPDPASVTTTATYAPTTHHRPRLGDRRLLLALVGITSLLTVLSCRMSTCDDPSGSLRLIHGMRNTESSRDPRRGRLGLGRGEDQRGGGRSTRGVCPVRQRSGPAASRGP